jgi:hypothetical protein
MSPRSDASVAALLTFPGRRTRRRWRMARATSQTERPRRFLRERAAFGAALKPLGRHRDDALLMIRSTASLRLCTTDAFGVELVPEKTEASAWRRHGLDCLDLQRVGAMGKAACGTARRGHGFASEAPAFQCVTDKTRSLAPIPSPVADAIAAAV